MRPLLTAILSVFFVSYGISQNTIYVNANASGGLNDGTSWPNAYVNLQNAINNSTVGDEIWVAEGFYFPSADINDNTNPADIRSKTFKLKAGVSVFGGFKGTETTKLPSPQNTYSILSGDLGVYGDNSDNAYHVMYNSGVNSGATVLKGFVIESGNCVGNSSDSRGAGLYNRSSNIIYSECVFRLNRADYGGGALSRNSNSKFILCQFYNNYAETGGGGLMCHDGLTVVLNSTFENNQCGNNGGGIFGLDAQLDLSASTFTLNKSDRNGGAVHLASSSLNWPWPATKIHNVVFENNLALNNGAALYAQARPAYISNIVCSNNTGSPAITLAGHISVSNILIHSNPNGGLVAASNSFGTEVNIYNSTLKQDATNGASAFISSSPFGTCNTKIYNTIIDGTIDLDSQTVVSYSYCLIPNSKPNGTWLNTLGVDSVGNVDGKPVYFSEVNKNYRLWKCSPGVDEGDSTLLAGDWPDIDYDLDTLETIPGDVSRFERISGKQVDIGALEYSPKALISEGDSALKSRVSNADSLIWLNCATGQIVSNDSIYQPLDTAVSYALVVIKNGCQDTSACGVFTPSINISEEEQAADFELFPNPASEILHLKFNQSNTFEIAQLISSSGELIKQYELSNQQSLKIEVGHIPAGFYVFQLTSAKGNTKSKIIIVQ